MGADLAQQWDVARGAAMLGVALCILLEIVQVIGYFLHGAFWRFCIDFARCVMVAGANFLYFRRMADGQVRWYDLLLEGLAALAFHGLIGRWAVRVLRRLLEWLFGLLWQMIRILLRPIRNVLHILSKILHKMLENIQYFFKKPFIFLKKYIIIYMYSYTQKHRRKEVAAHNGNEEKETDSSARFYH